jgi:uncharacterized GH25 family protein
MAVRAQFSRLTAVALGLVAVLVLAAVASAHDMFLRANGYFAKPQGEVLVRLINGEFWVSENSIVRSRVRDASFSGSKARVPIDMDTWTENGDTTTFKVRVGQPGTYAIGVSTRPSIIELKAEDFNTYLKDDGVPDVLADRKAKNELQKPARERYHKHVKTLIQVGDSLSNSFGVEFGYPAEIIPLNNPYSLKAGGTLRVRVKVSGKPVANQFVLFGGLTATGGQIAPKSARSRPDGTLSIPLPTAGEWYVKFINMTRVTGDSVDYESRWATLTFAVK